MRSLARSVAFWLWVAVAFSPVALMALAIVGGFMKWLLPRT